MNYEGSQEKIQNMAKDLGQFVLDQGGDSRDFLVLTQYFVYAVLMLVQADPPTAMRIMSAQILEQHRQTLGKKMN